MAPDVNDLSRIQALIDAASKRYPSARQLAQALGVSHSNVIGWHSGKRPCPVYAQALMAQMTGLDARDVTLWAVIQNERDPQRKEALFEAVGKGLQRMSLAAFAFMSANAVWGSDAGSYFIRCIERLNETRTYGRAALPRGFIPN